MSELFPKGTPIDSEEGKRVMAVMAEHLKSLIDECGPEVIVGMTKEEWEGQKKDSGNG